MNLSRQQKPIALHIASGDLWAGAEVQLYTLLTQLHKGTQITPHAALMNEGELAQRLRAQGIAVTIFDESRLNGLQILLGLRALMIALRPDIVHTHRTKENVLGALANLLATRAPSVRTVHGASEHPPIGLRNLHKRLFAEVDQLCGKYLQQRVIAVSKGMQAALARNFSDAKVVVIENGIDIDTIRSAIHPVDFRIEAPHACHIGIVGRLQPVKRVDLFLQTAALLIKQDPDRDWRFHVIGDGPLRPSLEQLSVKLGLAGHMRFHGHRSDSAACLAGLDALIMCSDHEGMPMTLLESITAGTPVLAHAVGGLAEVLQDNCGGLLVTDHSATGYAAGLIKLLTLPKETLLAAGQAHVQAHYSSGVNADKVCLLYRGQIETYTLPLGRS